MSSDFPVLFQHDNNGHPTQEEAITIEVYKTFFGNLKETQRVLNDQYSTVDSTKTGFIVGTAFAVALSVGLSAACIYFLLKHDLKDYLYGAIALCSFCTAIVVGITSIQFGYFNNIDYGKNMNSTSAKPSWDVCANIYALYLSIFKRKNLQDAINTYVRGCLATNNPFENRMDALSRLMNLVSFLDSTRNRSQFSNILINEKRAELVSVLYSALCVATLLISMVFIGYHLFNKKTQIMMILVVTIITVVLIVIPIAMSLRLVARFPGKMTNLAAMFNPIPADPNYADATVNADGVMCGSVLTGLPFIKLKSENNHYEMVFSGENVVVRQMNGSGATVPIGKGGGVSFMLVYNAVDKTVKLKTDTNNVIISVEKVNSPNVKIVLSNCGVLYIIDNSNASAAPYYVSLNHRDMESAVREFCSVMPGGTAVRPKWVDGTTGTLGCIVCLWALFILYQMMRTGTVDVDERRAANMHVIALAMLTIVSGTFTGITYNMFL
jgi:hypothetical protein